MSTPSLSNTKNPLVNNLYHNDEDEGKSKIVPSSVFLLQEDFFLLLQEDGFGILIEGY